ncbi:MAG: hypothetical protein R8G01_12150 [Ilumatobacteraceae bacterium]|nr:hypothetical protein [Ilumatobacteraceae bacterium]
MTSASVLLVPSACGSDDDSPAPGVSSDVSDPVDGAAPCLTAEQGDPAPDYVGLDEAEAQELANSEGLTMRVVGRDGECDAITLDLRDDRVNVDLVDGVVVAAAYF